MKRVLTFMAGLSALALAGCSTLQSLPSVQDRDNTPRQTGVIMQKELGPVVTRLSDACDGQLFTKNTADIIAEHGPTLRKTIGFYAASARSCLVVDGRLTTDPASGETCYRGTVQKASTALPAVLREVGLAVGGDTGRQVYVAAILASSLIGTGDGGVVDGFKKEPDVPIETYDAIWWPVQAAADRLDACARSYSEPPS